MQMEHQYNEYKKLEDDKSPENITLENSPESNQGEPTRQTINDAGKENSGSDYCLLCADGCFTCLSFLAC